ncbi:MAG: hypothetical protein REH79_01190 [Spiroplasma sp.]|nr:hypothetical protein [Spiroplasma sp.]
MTKFLDNDKKTQLDHHLLFQFRFIIKSKKVSDEFINHLKEISIQSIGQMMQGTKQQTGFSTIEVANTNLPNQLTQEFINYIYEKHNNKLVKKVKKYEYLRVGKVQRLYGKMYDGIFYALLYQYDKKNQ